ncbi:hypothetical protein [Rhizobium sp. A37_96]
MPTTTKVLAQALGSWLQFEYALGRRGLFNERYMSGAISQVLSYRFKCGISAEHRHPTLSAMVAGRPGAKPAVDFAAIETFPNVKALVESKWLNKSGVTVQSIVWDLIRLEMVAHAENAEAYFILAGRRDRMKKVFESVRYHWSDASAVPGSLLARSGRIKVPIKDLSPTCRDKLWPWFEKYSTGSFPNQIHLKQPYSYPFNGADLASDEGAPRYQVWVWEIDRKPAAAARFRPCDLFPSLGPQDLAA